MVLHVRQCLANFKQRIGAVGLRWASSSAPSVIALGVEIVDLTSDASGGAAQKITEQVLHVIEKLDGKQLRRLVAHSPRIAIVRGYQWAGQYWHYYPGIALEASVVERQVPMAIAMTLVHEATHARIAKAGVPYLPHRRRIEEICVRNEIQFATLAPGSAMLIEGARRKLATEV